MLSKIFCITASLFVVLANAVAESADREALARLQRAYQACAKGAPSLELQCRKDAFASEMRVYCRNRINGCVGGDGKGGAQFLDPKRCFSLDNCRVLANGDAIMSYKRTPGATCDATTQRTELTDPYLVADGQEVQYSMAMTLPQASDLKTKNGSVVVAQFKAVGGNSPPFALRYKSDGRLVATIRHNRGPNGSVSWTNEADGAQNGHEVQQEVVSRVSPGVPLNIQFQIKTGDPGYLRLMIDGKMVWSYDKALGYKDTANYFKFGPYDHTCTQSDLFSVGYSRFLRGSVREPFTATETGASRSAGDTSTPER